MEMKTKISARPKVAESVATILTNVNSIQTVEISALRILDYEHKG